MEIKSLQRKDFGVLVCIDRVLWVYYSLSGDAGTSMDRIMNEWGVEGNHQTHIGFPKSTLICMRGQAYGYTYMRDDEQRNGKRNRKKKKNLKKI